MKEKKQIMISAEYLNALKILKPREIQILELVANGHTSQEIGEKYYLSTGTVSNYRSKICKKLDLNGYRAFFHWCEEHITNQNQTNF